MGVEEFCPPSPAYHLVAAKLPWFEKINKQRTAVVHRGQTLLVYTDRISFNWGTLITDFRDLTQSMLAFSERLASTVLSEKDRMNHTEKTVIDGVYVRALEHLLKQYTVPNKSPDLKLKAQCLLVCGGYVEAAYIGYPNGFWWNVLTSSTRALKGRPLAAFIRDTGDDVHNCKFAISAANRTYGYVACDHGEAESDWLSGAEKSVKDFKSEIGAYRTALIVREMSGKPPEFLPRTKIPVIVDSNPSAIADAYARYVSAD